MTVEEQAAVTDEIFEYQPAILASFLALQKFVKDQDQLGHLFYIMLVIWDAFAEYPALKRSKITDDLQEKLNETNINFLKYLSDEKYLSDFNIVVESQIDSYRQVQTLAFVIDEIVNDKMGIFNIPLDFKGQLVCYIKTVIDCIDYVLTTGSGKAD